ncbi:hypothetical protein MMPV_001746 [Pyropia vietnamensis]
MGAPGDGDSDGGGGGRIPVSVVDAVGALQVARVLIAKTLASSGALPSPRNRRGSSVEGNVALSALRQLLAAVAPDLPPDLVATRTSGNPALPPDAPVYRFNYDAGHDGRVSVPGSDGGSVDLRWALRAASPWALLGGPLAFGAVPATRAGVHTPHIEDRRGGGGGSLDAAGMAREVAFFSPGLNTMHQSVTWDKTSTVDRVAHYARLLGRGWALTQLHSGTLMDQGDSPIDLTGARPEVFEALAGVEAALRAAEVANVPPLVGAPSQTAYLPSRARDAVQVVLSAVNAVDTRLKSAYRALIAAAASGDPTVPVAATSPAVDTAADAAVLATTTATVIPPLLPHLRLVLVTYSRTTVEIAAAVRGFLSRQPPDRRGAVRSRLRSRLLVVTVGSCYRDYPVGPAYLHLSSNADTLTARLGVSASRPAGAGGDDAAAFIHCASPFTAGSLEGHNFATLTCPYLAVLAASNRLVGWWAVYEAARAGRLVPPDDADALTLAAAVVSGADAFLFGPNATWASEGVRNVPNRDDALALLRSRVGGVWAAGLDSLFPAP